MTTPPSEERPRTLTHEEVHWGFPCMAGTEIDPFERTGVLARDFSFRGVLLPGGSTFCIDLDTDIRSVTICSSVVVHGHTVPEGSKIEFPSRWPLPLFLLVLAWPFVLASRIVDALRGRLRPSARSLVNVWPSRPFVVVIGQRSICVETREQVGFDHRGVTSLMLRSPRVIGGETFEPGDLLFDPQGRIREVRFDRSERRELR